MRHPATRLLAAVAMLCCIPAGAAAGVTNLCCEYRLNPLGIDGVAPRLSWVLEDLKSETRGEKQTAYQVLVASSEELLEKDRGDLLNSGKVASAQSVAVRYAGVLLASETRYWWKVRVYDQDGTESGWSVPAGFLTGKMNPADWRGKWIGPVLVRPAATVFALGFAVETQRSDEEKWVQVDLGQSQGVDRIMLHPLQRNDPAKDAVAVTESDNPEAKAKGIRFVRTESGAAVYDVGSGTYRFQSTLFETFK